MKSLSFALPFSLRSNHRICWNLLISLATPCVQESLKQNQKSGISVSDTFTCHREPVRDTGFTWGKGRWERVVQQQEWREKWWNAQHLSLLLLSIRSWRLHAGIGFHFLLLLLEALLASKTLTHTHRPPFVVSHESCVSVFSKDREGQVSVYVCVCMHSSLSFHLMLKEIAFASSSGFCFSPEPLALLSMYHVYIHVIRFLSSNRNVYTRWRNECISCETGDHRESCLCSMTLCLQSFPAPVMHVPPSNDVSNSHSLPSQSVAKFWMMLHQLPVCRGKKLRLVPDVCSCVFPDKNKLTKYVESRWNFLLMFLLVLILPATRFLFFSWTRFRLWNTFRKILQKWLESHESWE